jgi:hypothetical protein
VKDRGFRKGGGAVRGEFFHGDKPYGCSILPALMCKRSTIQLVPTMFPLGEKSVHQPFEPMIMGGFKQMNHFMDHHIFQALIRLVDEREVQPNPGRPGIARTPSRPHFLDAPSGDLHPEDGFPLLNQGRYPQA